MAKGVALRFFRRIKSPNLKAQGVSPQDFSEKHLPSYRLVFLFFFISAGDGILTSFHSDSGLTTHVGFSGPLVTIISYLYSCVLLLLFLLLRLHCGKLHSGAQGPCVLSCICHHSSNSSIGVVVVVVVVVRFCSQARHTLPQN